MPYTFTLTTTIPATAQEIYNAWLDSLSHSEMTGSAAKMSGEIGEEVSAWDNYITGRNLELVPGERIVQSWRTSEFGEEDEDSIITVTLEETEDGTLLTLEHSNVPDEQRSYEEGGWQENYFEPMVAYFTERMREPAAAEEPSAKAAVKPAAKAPKRAAKAAAKRSAEPARKAKRRAAKAKRAAPRAKAAARRKSKPRAVAAAKSRGTRKPAARKSTRGKRR